MSPPTLSDAQALEQKEAAVLLSIANFIDASRRTLPEESEIRDRLIAWAEQCAEVGQDKLRTLPSSGRMAVA